MKRHTQVFIVASNLILCLTASPIVAQTTPMPPQDLRTDGSESAPPLPPPAPAGSLGEIAAGMAPGSWVTLNTNGFNNGAIMRTPENGSILEFTDEAMWDPIHNRLYVLGTARGNGGYGTINQKWVEFSESTNTWSDLTATLPSGFYIGHHAYNHMAFDPGRGHYYVRFDNQRDPTVVYRYDTEKELWERMPALPSTGNTFGAIEYFPERDRLVFTDTSSGGKFSLLDPNTRRWSTESWGNAVSTDHNFSRYDPVNGFLYFGGGHAAPKEFFKMDRDGVVTRLAAPPIPLGISGSCTIHTVDPVSGKFLVFEIDGIIYEYDSVSNTWTTAGNHPLADVNGGFLMAVTAQIPEYGVLISVSYNPAGSTNGVYLYKH